MKLFSKQLHKKENGFTMTELLMVIAIIVILIGVAVPAVGTLRRNLRQRELDSKAEVIYMAAQSRLTQLRTGGFAELYGGVATDAVPDISQVSAGATVRDITGLRKDVLPTDAINTNGEAENLCYVVSEENENVAYVVLPEESVDRDLWNHHWVIEFDPEAGSVYAVFYGTESILDRTGDASTITRELNDLRGKSQRLADGARIGYYGGDLTQVNIVDKDSMTAVLKIINKEELVLDMTCITAEKPTFTVTIQDTAGNSYTKTIDPSTVQQPSAGQFHATWTLDSLKNGGSFFEQTEGKLLCGTDITVTLNTTRPWEPGIDLKDSASATTNSLFAWRGDYSGDEDTAYIAYGRHLQNLDNNTSHVLSEVKGISSNVSKAVQVQDVSFQKSTKEDSYYVTYGDRLFDPIHNSRIVSYMGQKIGTSGVPAISGLHIESSEPNVGLFTTFSGIFRDLRITGPKIQGGVSNVGTLMGAVTGNRATEINNVQVFLSDPNGDLDNQATDSVEKVNPWLTGRNVGGLIGSAGSNSLTIANSSASLPLEADRYAGGLVGMLNCTAKIYNSYADGYLRGTYVGGLIGGAGQRANITLQNFYAAGYAVAKETAAGLVVFDDSYNPLKITSNGYSVMDLEKAKGSEDVKFYALAPRCDNMQKTYYLPQQGITYQLSNTPGAEALSYEVLSSDQAFSYEQTVNGKKETVLRLIAPFKSRRDTSNVTHPYNLLNQGLTSYTYPKLSAEDGTDLAHYGDWKAEFEEGSLVYFERDELGRYRFEGGNISVDQIQADTSENDYTKRPKIVADGYALAYRSSKGTTWDGTATFGGNTIDLVKQQTMDIAGYTLYRLPADFLKNDRAIQNSTTFYQTLTVTETEKNNENQDVKVSKTYYFNPNFASCISSSLDARPEILRIRSPRQLYALSRLYEAEAEYFTNQTVIRQEMDLDYSIYDWENAYDKTVSMVSVQEPIGTEDNAFFVTYDGRSNTIQGLGIATKENQVGLFGKVEASGTIQNLVLLGEKGADQKYLVHNATSARPELSVADGIKTVNIGALVGWNKGTISNCAVTGFRIDLAAYNGVTVNVGGLVGRNEGGSISGSSAETPEISLRNYSSNTYAAGFVGSNSGTIYNSYAAGYLEVKEAKLETGKNTSRIAGFAARNDNGNLLRCYAGTPLMGSGDTEMFGFTASGGSVLRSYYLDGGTYEYRGQIYSLNASENGQRGQAGRTTSADDLEAMVSTLSGYGRVSGTYLGNENKDYPYPETVTRNGQYVHFGQWPNQDKDIGTFGVFYWEYESGGNSGYHLTFQGTADGAPMQGGSTLCTAHDDGGVITKYGYGYFYKPVANDPNAGKPHLEVENCVLGAEDTEASRELQKQMPQYTFVAYKTGSGDNELHMQTSKTLMGTRWQDNEQNRNAIWKLYYPYVTIGTGTAINEKASGVYTYSVSPFFGDAYNLIGISKADEDTTTEQNSRVTPGNETRPYQVRSIDQLQFINWNYWAGDAVTFISAVDQTNNHLLFDKYPYLSYGAAYNNGNKPTARMDLYWLQSHDLDAAKKSENFTPIGSMYDNAGNTGDAQATMAFFSASYDGQAYTIKNINMDTNAQCIGIFGATSGARLQNIILYSDNGSQIIHRDSKSWYAVGGIVGLAGSANDTNSYFKNCTVSGYSILDVQATNPGWGGGCLGGMVGATTMSITNCTAVTDIEINISYNGGYQNLRVGGLVGCARGSIDSSYAGGSMKSTSNITQGGYGSSANIWMGGILGGIILRNGGNLQALVGTTTVASTVTNCYSFVNMPARHKNGIKSSQAIASNGEMQEDFSTVRNDYIVITNSYALESAITNTDDYWLLRKESLKGTTNFKGINLNNTHYVSGPGIASARADWWDRRIQLDNDRDPYISYRDMSTSMFTWLNDGVKSDDQKFAPVTTTENAASINGKYSFPGGDSQLVGLDYPFPTILTQTDVDGNTVNIHYGAWPKFGIYWQEHKVTMDLLALRNTTGVNLLALYGDQAEPVETGQSGEIEEPENTGPGETEPEETVPETTVPDETVPETTVPETTIPETTIPETTAPETTVSETAALEETEPEAEEAQPASTEPTEGEEETVTLAAAFQTLDANTIQAVQTYNLYVVGIGTAGIGTPTYELQDETGTAIAQADEGKAAARILASGTTLVGGDHYEVTFLAQHPGTVRVLATVNQNGTDYTALLTVTVTADLRIKVEESKLPLKTYVGDPMQDAMVTLEDSKGVQFKPGDGATLTWALAIDSQESEQALVTWTANGFIETRQQPVTGGGTEDVFYLTSLKGFSDGEGSLKLSLTYQWDQDADPVETSVIIPIEVYPSDVLGLGDGVIAQEVEIPHSDPASANGKARTEEENIPTLDGKSLFLYASNETDADGNHISYTDLTKFQVTKAELKRGGSYREMAKVVPEEGASEPNTDDFTYQVDEDHTITFKVDKEVVSTGDRNQRFIYRPITVEGDTAEQWTLRLTLQPVDDDGNLIERTYVLEYARPNTVTFAYQAEDGAQTELRSYRVDQGQDLSDLDQDTLDEELQDLAKVEGLNVDTGEGHHYTWALPEDAIDANRTITQVSKPIRYYMAYDAGYEDYEWDDNVPMEKDTFTYGEDTKHLKANEYNRPGYVFAGWAATIGGTKTYDDQEAFIDRTGVTDADGQTIVDIFTASGTQREHNAIITLYAVWQPKEYTITYNGNFSGWNDEGMVTMASDTYSIGAEGGTVKDNAFQRPGYTFQGWAFDAAKTEPDIVAGDTLDKVMHQGGEYVVYSDVTLYAVWKQDATEETADTLETPEAPEAPMEEETELPEEPETPIEEPTEGPEAPTEAPEPVEETEPPEEPTQEPPKAPEEEGDTKEKGS